jgi:Uma2 family endonuclease
VRAVTINALFGRDAWHAIGFRRRYNEPMSGSDRVNPASPGQKLTYDDLLQFPEDDGMRHELIDGEHYVTASPNLRHQRISQNLFSLINSWLEEHPIGTVWYAPLDVVFSDADVVVPDVLYLSKDRMADVATPQHLRGAPNLVIEIGSPGTRKRDETIKKHLYERSGVDVYWVVDPETDVVRVYRREGEGFGRVTELSRESGDTLTTPLLPGLELPLVRIFRE